MPEQRFRGDPYQALDIAHSASDAQIKRRWRELAREHHPDRAAGDAEVQAHLTMRMARINAAYDVLRDPVRRAAYDSSPQGRLARAESRSGGDGVGFEDGPIGQAGGPPPPPRTRPVTARFDTTAAFRPRNARTGERQFYARSQPTARRGDAVAAELRASTPTGPVSFHSSGQPQPLPTLREAREAMLNFGRFHGYSLGEVELLEPTYLDWVARTITRDRDLVVKARVILADLDERGEARPSSAATPGFGSRAAEG
ncbi:MAG: J domain-containing protein [Chloroflexota bacterium]